MEIQTNTEPLLLSLIFFQEKVPIWNKHFRNTLPCGINLQITNKSIDLERGDEPPCVGVSKDYLCK